MRRSSAVVARPAEASAADRLGVWRRDIVCLSFVGWDDYWGTPQQIMSRLARHNRVLFVNPAVSPFSFATESRGAGFAWNRLKPWLQGPREVAANVYTATPPPVLPFRYRRFSNRTNGAIVGRWLKRLVEALGFERPIVWNFLPSVPPSVGRALDQAGGVYHCVDEFASVPHWWNATEDVRSKDRECCREADVVICTGRNLAAGRRGLNQCLHIVPNGADVELFARAAAPETEVPADIAALPRPVVGFCGVIDFRFDVDLVKTLASREPGWSIVLVGHSAPGSVGGGAESGKGRRIGGIDLSELLAFPNVHLLGWKPRDRLPAYLKGMDVCLIPYVDSEFVRHVFPLKFFEYMAAGKPIVATNLEELRPYEGELVSIAGSPSKFHEAVAGVLENDSAELAARRCETAWGHSWDSRVAKISSIVGSVLR